MTLIEILYDLTIGPLELFFEVVYMMAYRVIGSPSLAIIALSLAMNFLVLPLYRRADAMQEEERQTEERLGAGVRHIKQVFKGDERMMILQTYYRQNHYRQSYVLRGSLPLLLEIPFFIGAYRFLSTLSILDGVSFGPIADLGAPDGLIVIGSVTVNLLPVLMTVINIVSSSIYADHMATKTRVQLYVMAAIFLVFLYDSPAGLVFYWTLNNLFSLIKNVFYKLPNPRKVLRCLSIVIGIVAIGYCGLVYDTPSMLRKMILVGGSALLIIVPLLQMIIARRGIIHSADNSVDNSSRLGNFQIGGGRKSIISTNSVYISGILYLTVLVGGLIPSAVIASSPEDFVSRGAFYDPMGAVEVAFCLAAGFFLVWCTIFYYLAGSTYRRHLSLVMIACSVIATLDYMVFRPASKSGNLSSTLVYDHGLVTESRLVGVGIVVTIVVALVVVLTSKRWTTFWRSVAQVACIVILVMTCLNVVKIRQSISNMLDRSDFFAENYQEDPFFTLSKSGKNVVVIMLDRAIGSYVPYLLEERPELCDQWDGFTYYPNTLSFGGHTTYGSPALLGGYEYTPQAINERVDERLVDKHDEALLTMPVLFSNEGYDVTVCDPPYAGYAEKSDFGIYEDYPGINAIFTEGRTNPYLKIQEEERYRIRKRNLFCYSIVRCMPLVLQKALYNEGQYNTAPIVTDDPYAENYVERSAHQVSGYDTNFMNAYLVLQDLDQLTEITDNEKGAYVFLNNNTVHESKILQEPEYTPEQLVNNTEYDRDNSGRFEVDGVAAYVDNTEQIEHYESMMASMLRLGEWFDYLRQNDLYDNTRIILVSDHAYDLGSFPDRIMENGIDTMAFNPILMVKDYDAHGFETSEEFMTNADVPYLTVNGLIDNPINPFTGKAITNEPKNGLQYVLISGHWGLNENQGNQFLVEKWLSVKDDVRDLDNWDVACENEALPDHP